jgi:hypothetical protein
MVISQFVENPLRARSEFEQHFAAILTIALAAQISTLAEAVHELDGAVVLNLQAICDFSDQRPHSIRNAFNRDENLMLARLQTSMPGSVFARAQVFPDLIADFSQTLIFRQGEITVFHIAENYPTATAGALD